MKTYLLHQIKMLVLFCTFLLLSNNVSAQTINMPAGTNTYPGGVPSGTTITFCDNGGNAANYSNSFTGTYTFCPQTAGEIICISFTFFDTRNNDDVFVYGGTTATGTQYNASVTSGTGVAGLQGQTFASTVAGGCITVKFTSNSSGANGGWVAAVTSNKPCGTVTAAQGTPTVYVCPANATNPGSGSISFDGSASSTTSPQVVDQWSWSWGDGTSSIVGSSSTTHAYGSPGFYKVSLQVNDNSTSNCVVPASGCASTNVSEKFVGVLRAPVIVNQSTSLQKICEGASATLQARVRSQSIQTKREDPNPGPLFVPDVVGTPYTSTALLKSFSSSATVNASCTPSITVCMEHDYVGDLTIQIVAPDGKTATLIKGGNLNGDDLGCAPSGSSMGGCFCYTFVASGAAKSLKNTGGTITTTCASGPNAIVAGIYNANPNASGTPAVANGLSGILNAPIVGTWTLKIIDELSANNGWVCDWDIKFPSACYALSDATPDIVGANWSAQGSNPASVTINNLTKTIAPYIPTGTGGTVNDGSANPDNVSLALLNDPNGNDITNNQSPTFSSPGVFAFDFNYSDDRSPSCDYLLTKTVKVFDIPSLSALSCLSTTSPTSMDILGVPTIDNSNHTGADIGQWEYSKNGTTWQTSTNFSSTPGATYTIHVRNSAMPSCTASIVCSVALPVELIGFTAALDGSFGLLNWETANEKNNNYFDIEKSTDGINFHAIGRVKGAGNSSTIKAYSYVDYKLGKGTVYYRLKQIDFDGKSSMSSIVSIDIPANIHSSGIASIQPNPLPKGSSSVDVVYYADKESIATILVRNTIGQLVYKKDFQLTSGENKLNVSFESVVLSAGAYYIEVQTPVSNEIKRLMIEN